MTTESVEYRTSGKHLLVQGKPLQVQGITWFGLETNHNSPAGLLHRSLESYLETLVDLKFNVLRIPFSIDMLLNKLTPTAIDYELNQGLKGKDSFGVLEYMVAACAERGILKSIDSWITLVTRLKNYWNVWALDIKNEPHGIATWSTGNRSTDWDAAFARISKAIGVACPWFNGVYMVQV
eukprot:gene5951-6894_t